MNMGSLTLKKCLDSFGLDAMRFDLSFASGSVAARPDLP